MATGGRIHADRRDRRARPDDARTRGGRVRDDGTFEVHLPWDGPTAVLRGTAFPIRRYVVAIEFPGHAPALSPEFITEGQSEPARAHLVLDSGCELRGRLVRAPGAVPAPGIGLVLHPRLRSIRMQDAEEQPWPASYAPGASEFRATTAADGTFAIPRVPPGDWRLWAPDVQTRADAWEVTLPPNAAEPPSPDFVLRK